MKFAESISLKVPQDFNHLLSKAMKYIQYEKMLEADELIGTRIGHLLSKA